MILTLSNIIFRDPDNDLLIEKKDIPDFLNKYFVEIATRTRGDDCNIDTIIPNDIYPNVLDGLDLEPVTDEAVSDCVNEIDVNMSSCVEGINMKLCKILIENFPGKFAKLFSNSLFLGIFPKDWARSVVTLLPKTGDMTNPGNWRPISQTCLFAKLLERIVHSRFLRYLLDNKLISEYQFGFLPNRSTQEAVFEVTKSMYTAINSRKMMGLIFLDVAKGFNCIHHERLYNKLYSIGCSNRFVAWLRSYLTRTQVVSIGNKTSFELPVFAGIAQGTVLGLLIFIFYINDVIQVISKC